jgi:hypothetical protein
MPKHEEQQKLEPCDIQQNKSATLLEAGFQHQKKGNEHLGRIGFVQVATVAQWKMERFKVEVQQEPVVVVLDN